MSDLSRADELRELLHSGEGPLFIHARVDADDQKRIIPSRDGVAIKHRFMQAIGSWLTRRTCFPFPRGGCAGDASAMR